MAGPSPRMEKKSVRKITNSAAFYKSAGPNDERFYGKSMQNSTRFVTKKPQQLLPPLHHHQMILKEIQKERKLHAFSSYKKRFYKKRLVDFTEHKKRQLVDLPDDKKRVS